ncbi:MAG TPA: hypothetical protein VL307_13630 [Chitinophagaceae bacterium]|nr:hypothetical protein [Chitinophagaceae bacterium]
MKYILVLSLYMVCCYTSLHAQTPAQHPSPAFHSINAIGLLQGQAGGAVQVQSINGVLYKGWFAGLGAGVDYYRFRTVPVFASLRKYFNHHNNRFFAYGDAGLQFNWLTDTEKSTTFFIADGALHKGFYSDAGLGYALGSGKSASFFISAGYSYKRVSYSRQDFTPFSYDGPAGSVVDRYSLGRISIKAGLIF